MGQLSLSLAHTNKRSLSIVAPLTCFLSLNNLLNLSDLSSGGSDWNHHQVGSSSPIELRLGQINPNKVASPQIWICALSHFGIAFALTCAIVFVFSYVPFYVAHHLIDWRLLSWQVFQQQNYGQP